MVKKGDHMPVDLDREKLHKYYDGLAGGVCLISADRSEKILFINDKVPGMYACADEAQFMELCGGTFRGMIERSDYLTLMDLEIRQGEFKMISFHYQNRDQHFRYVEGPVSRIQMENGQAVILLQFFPASEIRANRKTDERTGLPGMYDFFSAALAEQKKRLADNTFMDLCPVSFNVANFREYNRMYGMHAGDICIRKIAEVLKETFPGDLIGHFTADTFAGLVKRENVIEKAERVCEQVDVFIHNNSITLKAGLVLYDRDDNDQELLGHAFDMAKVACESIKADSTQSVSVYTREMGEKYHKRSYVIANFDEALEKGYIKVYFQPVVRTISGNLCGCEALARWEDPEKGMIPPSVFIPILEDARLIARLDTYVIEWTARLIHDRMDTGLPPIPVSVNLSRLDFDLMKPLDVIERIVQKYKIPKSMIHIELTERVMAWNRQNLIRVLKDFHDAGYQVWLDDFGSEYSSLNTLHHYHFDVLKIDMGFFRDFNETGRKIIASVMKMAELLGMHTLAEGVENQEQLDFLREVGCGRIQGYYYGEPMCYEDCIAAWARDGLKLETAFEMKLFDAVEKVDIRSRESRAIFQMKDGELTLLQINNEYKATLNSIHTPDMEAANRNLTAASYPMKNKLGAFMEKVFHSGKQEQIVYVDDGQVVRVRAKKIAGIRDYWLGEAEFTNLSKDEDFSENNLNDRIMRNTLQIYDGLYYLNIEKDQLEVLESVHPKVSVGTVFHHIQESFQAYANELVYLDDRRRFLDYIDLEHIYADAVRSGRYQSTSLFRVRREDGTYRWTIFDAIVLYKSENRDILLCERQDLWESQNDPDLWDTFVRSFRIPSPDESSYSVEKGVLRAIVRDSNLKMFWKDKDRRFLGVSDAFLRYHEISDAQRASELIGEKAEDLNLNIDGEELYAAEMEVLEKGSVIQDAVKACVINGKPRTLSMSAFPFYQNKEIAGLVGIFRDLREYTEDEERALIDPDSGFLNFYGLLMAGLQYADDCRMGKEDYAGVLFFAEEYTSLCRLYGESFGRDLSQSIIHAVSENLPENATISHIGQGCFILLISRNDRESVHRTALKIAASVRKIQEVNGCQVSMYMQYSVAFGSEVRSFDMFLKLLIERLQNAAMQHYGKSIFTGDRIMIWKSALDTCPDQIYILDPDTYRLEYINQSARQALRLPENFSCTGEKCYEVLEGQSSPCTFCQNKRLKTSEFCSETHRNRKTGADLLSRSILVPWRDKYLRMTISSDLSRYAEMNIERNELVYHEAKVNDAIAIGMQESDPETGLQKMLAKIGDNLQADRILIFEQRDGNMFSCTYEWGRGEGIPLMGELQSIPMDNLRPLYQMYSEYPVVLVKDYEEFCAAKPGFHMPVANIHNFVSGQLKISGRPIGFTFVINCSQDTFTTARLLLSTLTSFFAIMMRNRDTLKRIEEQSVRDPLTGALNRRGLKQYLENWKGDGTLSLISGDINGLKTVNDTMGHHEGDILICSAANVMMRHANRDHVFRTGDDEFLLIAENISEVETQDLIAKIKNEGRSDGLSLALGYTINVGPVENIDQLLTEADRHMYEDKGQTYRRRWNDPPARRNR